MKRNTFNERPEVNGWKYLRRSFSISQSHRDYLHVLLLRAGQRHALVVFQTHRKSYYGNNVLFIILVLSLFSEAIVNGVIEINVYTANVQVC